MREQDVAKRIRETELELITVGEFLKELLCKDVDLPVATSFLSEEVSPLSEEVSSLSEEVSSLSGRLLEGRQKGYLEEQDVNHPEALIERRQAARIIHQYLRIELGEADLIDWDAAKTLLDLYDCRVCVNHVAQVYAKGIVDGILPRVFGMKEGILRDELKLIVARVEKPECRVVRK